MVTKQKKTQAMRELTSNFVTPYSFVTPSFLDMGSLEQKQKQAQLTSPMSPHTIRNLSRATNNDHEASVLDNVVVKDVIEGDEEEDVKEVGEENEEVECCVEEDEDVHNVGTNLSVGSNLLIPELYLFDFVTTNFVCKHCHNAFYKRNLEVDRVGFATNIFWQCCSPKCHAGSKILAKTSTGEASGRFQRIHPELPAALGDYNINWQVVLACQ